MESEKSVGCSNNDCLLRLVVGNLMFITALFVAWQMVKIILFGITLPMLRPEKEWWIPIIETEGGAIFPAATIFLLSGVNIYAIKFTYSRCGIMAFIVPMLFVICSIAYLVGKDFILLAIGAAAGFMYIVLLSSGLYHYCLDCSCTRRDEVQPLEGGI